MTKDTALDLALEALQSNLAGQIKKGPLAITAIKQARSAPVQEPVGKIESSDFGNCVQFFSGKMPPVGSWLYTTPPAAQRPVPEERKWVGLTDEEILECRSVNLLYFYKAIEAKLRSKNNG